MGKWLSQEVIGEIHALTELGVSRAEIGRRLGVDPSTVSNRVNAFEKGQSIGEYKADKAREQGYETVAKQLKNTPARERFASH